MARGINISMVTSNIIAWNIPETELLPLDFTLAAVLAIAPVAGIHPNNPQVILAIP